MFALGCFHSIIVDNNLICVLFSGEKGITQDKSEAQICDRTSTFSMRLNGKPSTSVTTNSKYVQKSFLD